MKIKHVILALTILVFQQEIRAQFPDKISYQAVIRNSAGQLVTNQQVSMQVCILQGSATGATVFTQTFTPTTNVNGLISIEIGGGAGFENINWADGPYYIKTECDPAGGTDYTITGTSQILSVPYALHAKTAESYAGDEIFFEDNGQIASFDDNHRILFRRTENILEMREFGKIVFSPGATDGSETNRMILLEDGHVELDNKNIRNVADPVDAQDAATKAYVDANGGFSGDYNDLTNKPDIITLPNILIGKGAGSNSPGDRKTVAIGDSALYHNGSGAVQSYHSTQNTAIGMKALMSNTIGSNNTSLGFNALISNEGGQGNTALGNQTMFRNISGYGNTAIGSRTMFANATGYNNTATGYYALLSNNQGVGNTANGYYALNKNTNGSYNVAVGNGAMEENITGKENVAIGAGAGLTNKGKGNIFIGYHAGDGYDSDDKLYINNTSGTPLIYGDFTNNAVTINGDLKTAGHMIVGNTGTGISEIKVFTGNLPGNPTEWSDYFSYHIDLPETASWLASEWCVISIEVDGGGVWYPAFGDLVNYYHIDNRVCIALPNRSWIGKPYRIVVMRFK